MKSIYDKDYALDLMVDYDGSIQADMCDEVLSDYYRGLTTGTLRQLMDWTKSSGRRIYGLEDMPVVALDAYYAMMILQVPPEEVDVVARERLRNFADYYEKQGLPTIYTTTVRPGGRRSVTLDEVIGSIGDVFDEDDFF